LKNEYTQIIKAQIKFVETKKRQAPRKFIKDHIATNSLFSVIFEMAHKSLVLRLYRDLFRLAREYHRFVSNISFLDILQT
jgi:hypothetical protein